MENKHNQYKTNEHNRTQTNPLENKIKLVETYIINRKQTKQQKTKKPMETNKINRKQMKNRK